MRGHSSSTAVLAWRPEMTLLGTFLLQGSSEKHQVWKGAGRKYG